LTLKTGDLIIKQSMMHVVPSIPSKNRIGMKVTLLDRCRLAVPRTLLRQVRTQRHLDGNGLALFPHLLSGFLSEGCLSLPRDGDLCRRLAQPRQGRLERSAAVAARRALSDPDPRDRRVIKLRRRRDNLRRVHAVCRDLAHRRDRQQPFAELLHNVHCSAQHHRSRLCAAPPVSPVISRPAVASGDGRPGNGRG
jgi:hypothetical protein